MEQNTINVTEGYRKWEYVCLQYPWLTTAFVLFHSKTTSIICLLGNVFVIAAIILERNLQSVANYLILSLAVADLLVAVLVMPLGAIYEVSCKSTLLLRDYRVTHIGVASKCALKITIWFPFSAS